MCIAASLSATAYTVHVTNTSKIPITATARVTETSWFSKDIPAGGSADIGTGLYCPWGLQVTDKSGNGLAPQYIDLKKDSQGHCTPMAPSDHYITVQGME